MTVSLNKPVAGSQNWDVPVNENWTTIESTLNTQETAIGSIQTQLNNKADADLSNLSVTGNTKLRSIHQLNWSGATSLAGNLYNSASSKFTAPSDGVLIYFAWNSSIGSIFVNGVEIANVNGSGLGYGMAYPLVLPLNQGDTFYQTGATTSSAYSKNGKFVPYK